MGMGSLQTIISGVAVVAICAVGTVLVDTTGTANDNANEIERRKPEIEAIPKMQTDIEVIKTEQKHIRDEVGDIKDDTKEILQELRRRPQ